MSASGQIKTISMQEEPKAQIISWSEDRCTFMQQSDIFNRITNDDTDLEIMFDVYDKYSTTCRKSGSNSLLHIWTDIKGLTFLVITLINLSKCQIYLNLWYFEHHQASVSSDISRGGGAQKNDISRYESSMVILNMLYHCIINIFVSDGFTFTQWALFQKSGALFRHDWTRCM